MTVERPISWLKGAMRDFAGFPPVVQADAARALVIAANGKMAETAKPPSRASVPAYLKSLCGIVAMPIA